MPTVSQLINALPQEDGAVDEASDSPSFEGSMFPLPVGGLHRMRLLATLKAKVAAAYVFFWLRGWFKNSEQREQLLAETHWRNALRVLDSMAYLRGVAMKAGQMLAAFPDVAPTEFTDTLSQLQFDAPPMHFSLLREMVHNELGDEPEDLFASFETRAFAAASLGQVHRARLKTGQEVAVKIQYPGIARAVREDFRNLFFFLLPGRLSSDWENTREQFEDLRTRIEREADYLREAASLQRAASLFTEADGIVVPRVFPDYSTSRVLTMQRLEGLHLNQFLATNPSQELRNEFARKIVRAWYRMLYAGRVIYVDYNPGNFIFMPDGRLGLIDFGCMLELDERLWEMFHKMDRPITTGDRDGRIAFIKKWSSISDSPADAERLRLMDEYLELSWQPRSCNCEFDFSDEPRMRRGMHLFADMVKKRYTRGHATSPIVMRQQLGLGAMLYRMKAKIDIAPIAEEEVTAAGWDRSDYAPR